MGPKVPRSAPPQGELPPSKPQYRGVYLRNGKFQVYPSRNWYLGTWATEAEAAENCAKALAVSVESLRVPEKPALAPVEVLEPGTLAWATRDAVTAKASRYQAVYFHKGQRWRYLDSSNSWVYGVTESEGGAEIVKMFRQAQRDKKDTPMEPVTDGNLKRYFQALSAIYQDLEPGDLADVRRHWVQHQAMFEAEPGIEVIWVQGKFSPWRRNLFQVWQALQEGGAAAKALRCRITKSWGAPELPKHVSAALVKRTRAVVELIQGTLLAMDSVPVE